MKKIVTFLIKCGILVVPTERRKDMAYKKNTTVVSVPLSNEMNQVLRELAILQNEKSKTQLASRILSDAIRLEYRKVKKEQKWNKNTNT